MPKPTKAQIKKNRDLLLQYLSVLNGDVGAMRTEALRASEQDTSVDHLADQGTDNYDQGFLLGRVESGEESIKNIEEALERMDGGGDFPYGACVRCLEAVEREKAAGKKGKKIDPWIPKERLEYIPWARLCVAHQEEQERGRESA